MKKILWVVVVVLTTGHLARASAQQGIPFANDRTLSVMTWNVYHGVDAEIFNVLNATDPNDLAIKVAAVYQAYGATDFPGRAEAIAAQIAESGPALIGLQEVIVVRTQSPPDGPLTPAVDVDFDVLDLILDALAARGLHYTPVVEAVGFEAELPSAFGFDVRHTNRDVILARSDLKTADLQIVASTGQTFATNCQFETFLGPVTITRAWGAADIRIRGKSFRVISTHLESNCGPFTVSVRSAQAGEILAGPAATDLPVLLIGDLNSPTDGTGVVYNGLRAAGFDDVWQQVGAGFGFTCCQLPDLSNGGSFLFSRIDLLLTRGPWQARGAMLVGDDPLTDKTLSGLWPSDHAGVVGTVALPNP